MVRIASSLVTVILLLPVLLWAGTTGKIAGKVVDQETSEPLPGANVVVQGTTLGAAADLEGKFVILNVPPGRYTVSASMIGYTTQKVENVRVTIDLTTEVEFELRATVLETGSEVVVTAERPLVQRDLTSTIATTSGEEIRSLPVEEVDEVIQMEAGIVRDAQGNLHIRGGRATEVAYLVDGVPVTDPFSGGSSIDVENQGVQELQVISGTFNAEYGQAQSGIVNIVTREGGSEYRASYSGYLGSHVSGRNDLFLNIDNPRLTNFRNSQGTLSGPVPYTDKRVTFFSSFRYVGSNGFLYGQRRSRIEDTEPVRVFATQVDRGEIDYQRGERTGALNIPDSLTTGDGAFVPMNPLDAYSFQGRLSYRLLPNIKLSYSAFWDYSTGKPYVDEFRYAPDGVAPFWKWGYTQTFSVTHTLNSRSFYVLNLSSFSKKTESFLYEDPLDPRYQASVFRSGGFTFGGTQNTQSFVKNSTVLAKLDFTIQLDRINLVKTGVEIKRHDLRYHAFSPFIKDTYDPDSGRFVVVERYVPGIDNPANNKYRFKPIEAAFYVQDKLELREIVLNVGVRLDYLDPRAQVPENLRATVENGRLASPFRDTSKKYKVSPRLGLSFPISDQGAIHLAYGQFFQIPPLSFLYDNATFKIGVGGRIGGVVGNADLEPERTVAYELGLQQQLAANTALSVTLYYKNIKNLLGMELIDTENRRLYARYINRDFGNVRGIIFALDQRRFGPLAATLDFTFQVARGNSSDPRQVLLDNQASPPRESERQVLPLNWDQRHTLNATLSLSEPGKWGVSLIGRFGTGQPYTPTNPGLAISAQYRNSARKPSQSTVDLRAYKDFKINKLTASVFLKVFNLFDTANQLTVYSSTGRADRTYRTPGEAEAARENRNFTLQERDLRPEWYSEPRRMLVGLSLRF
jgi:outer membrane receptor protein involved in Fe transport